MPLTDLSCLLLTSSRPRCFWLFLSISSYCVNDIFLSVAGSQFSYEPGNGLDQWSFDRYLIINSDSSKLNLNQPEGRLCLISFVRATQRLRTGQAGLTQRVMLHPIVQTRDRHLTDAYLVDFRIHAVQCSPAVRFHIRILAVLLSEKEQDYDVHEVSQSQAGRVTDRIDWAINSSGVSV